MQTKIPRNYFIVGFIFGMVFPLVAIPIEMLLSSLPINWSSLAKAHQSNQLLYIIDTAPLFLGSFAWFGGVKQAQSQNLLNHNRKLLSENQSAQIKLQEINDTLERQVNQRTSELIQINRRLSESELNYRTIVNEFPDLILKLDDHCVLLACEGGLQDQLLQVKENYIGMNADDVLPFELTEQLRTSILHAVDSREVAEYEYSLALDGTVKYYKAKLIPQNNGEQYAFISDITRSANLLKEIEHLSYYDQLTGLYNRRFLEIEYHRLSNSRNLPLTVLALDINGLKLINDAFGHHLGDYLLREVSKAISSSLRSDEILSRMGGDEFAVLLPRTDEICALKIMDRIRRDVSLVEVNGVTGSISIGSSTANEVTMKLDDMLRNADEKMYKLKNRERQEFRSNAVSSMYKKLISLNDREDLHCKYVYETVMKIADQLNLTEDQRLDLGISAKYHDIGKLALPGDLLLKNESLSPEEYDQIKKHSEIGFQIIRSSDIFSHVAENILHHHENWDGTGYPGGLSGENIPLFSRIIHVADAFESMIHYRPYRMPRTQDEALEELIRYSGKQFDPLVVVALIKGEFPERASEFGSWTHSTGS